MVEAIRRGIDAVKSQRKFTIAMLFWFSGTAGMAFEILSGGEYVMLAAAVLGLYGYANVQDKKV